MKIALVHYWLTGMRGGERVLEKFCRLWPEADIFTHAFNPAKISPEIRKHKITCSFINRLPGAGGHCQRYLPLMPWALQQLDLSKYDLIVSSESGPAKGFRKPPHAFHVCYCHTPMRYLWDMYDDYYHHAGWSEKLAMSLFRRYLQNYDRRSAETVDRFLANSQFVAERIKRIYGRDSTVIYPPVDVNFFRQGRGQQQPLGNYYLFVGQLNHYKRPDLAVAICRQMRRPLVVIGQGPNAPQLRKLANDTPLIRFIEHVSDEELRTFYQGARGLLFPGIEDFGMVPVEAQAAGTPVIALRAGGALETVVDNQTGVFFDQPDLPSLGAAIESFETKKFSPEILQLHVEKFSISHFRQEILAAVKP